MAGLAAAAAAAMLWTAGDAELGLALRAPPAPPSPAWFELAAEDAGFGGSLLSGRAGYDDGDLALAVAVGWRLAPQPGWRDSLALSFEASRRAGQIEAGLRLWGGVDDVGGGLGGEITLRRRF